MAYKFPLLNVGFRGQIMVRISSFRGKVKHIRDGWISGAKEKSCTNAVLASSTYSQ
jgi:hypothetical protein